MALAGPPGAGFRDPEAGRVPCPLCGGLIHPVAGRCKHCKQDLVAHRGARPAAAAPLPAILGAPGAPGISREPVRAREAAGMVLPVEPTGTAVAPPRPAWRSWPVIAIAVATVAILVAIVLMLWPPHARHGASGAGAPPAATEHMDTDPEPPRPDPWASPQGRADPVPVPNPAPFAPRADQQPPAIAVNPPPQALPQPQLPDPLPPDPPGGLGGGIAGGVAGNGAGGGFGQLGGTALGSTFMLTALAHACARLKTCPDPDASLSTMCDAFATLPTPPPPAGCTAAQRCLDAIDHLSCSQAAGDMPANVLMMFSDCSTAMTSC